MHARLNIPCTVLVTLMALPLLASAGDAPPGTKPSPDQVGTGTPPTAETSVVRLTGKALLEHLHAAQAALEANNVSMAQGELLASQALTRDLLRTKPDLAVVNDIDNAIGHINDAGDGGFLDALLPVYVDLDGLALNKPEMASAMRNDIRKAEDDALNGRTDPAREILQRTQESLAMQRDFVPAPFVDAAVSEALRALASSHPRLEEARLAVDRAVARLAPLGPTRTDCGTPVPDSAPNA